LLTAGAFRVAPLQGEMTLSFLGRIAASEPSYWL
jgi:hypothetical protein